MTQLATIGYVTDIEGDLDFWNRYVELSDVLTKNSEGLVDVADGAHFVFGGDAVDNAVGDLAVLEALVSLKERYPDRVHLIMGNRDINKLRLATELSKMHRDQMTLREHPGVYWTPDASPSKKLTEEELAENDEVSRLKWILRDTMGAPQAFENRRCELSHSQNCTDISDEDIVASFREYASPTGVMFKFLRCAQLAALVGDTLFVHAGLPRAGSNWMPGWVPGQDPGKLLTLLEWLEALEQLRATALVRYEECSPTAQAWSIDGGYDHEQPGSALCQYSMRDLPDGSWQGSIVYNGWVDDAYQPIMPNEATLSWLREAGVRRVVSGHKPHGDAPLILRIAHDIDAITADTCYAGCVQWIDQETTGSSDCSTRGSAVCEVLLGPTPEQSRIHGFLSNGSAFEAMLSDGMIGRLTEDGWRVKAHVGNKLLLCRNEEWSFYNKLVDESSIRPV